MSHQPQPQRCVRHTITLDSIDTFLGAPASNPSSPLFRAPPPDLFGSSSPTSSVDQNSSPTMMPQPFSFTPLMLPHHSPTMNINSMEVHIARNRPPHHQHQSSDPYRHQTRALPIHASRPIRPPQNQQSTRRLPNPISPVAPPSSGCLTLPPITLPPIDLSDIDLSSPIGTVRTIDLTADHPPAKRRRRSSNSSNAQTIRSTSTVITLCSDDDDEDDDDDDEDEDEEEEEEEEEEDDDGYEIGLQEKERQAGVEAARKDAKPKRLADASCIICLEDRATNMSVTPCGHMFCHNCLYNSIKASLGGNNKLHGKCPICRGKVGLKDIVVLRIRKGGKGKGRAEPRE